MQTIHQFQPVYSNTVKLLFFYYYFKNRYKYTSQSYFCLESKQLTDRCSNKQVTLNVLHYTTEYRVVDHIVEL